MNILTDILSLYKRRKFVTEALPNDVIVLGLNQEPDMTGIASPIPYKSVRLIKVKDLNIAADHCDHTNTPMVPAANSGTIYQQTYVDPETQKCTVYYRTLRSLSTNLTLNNSADNDYVELSTTGEPNTAANVGTGAGVWKNKVGETLNFKSLNPGNNISMAETENEITISATTTSLPYTSYVQLLNQASGVPTGPILENSAGITITWSYNAAGQYVATYSTPLADINKVAVRCSNTTKTASGGTVVSVTASFASGFNVVSTNMSGTGIDGQLLGAVLEIRIYP
tara:strand:- start:2910 stop:3758 length:849 start_codon:yes stop_codon:yes gene_type:complete